MGGSKAVPQWFLNLQAAGKAHILLRGKQQDVNAQLISGAEREMLWPLIAARAPHFAKWQLRTGRTFPIAILTVRTSPS
jgi:deazaflavin-dependent oxidoreductase (nitroreductase family)